ncbi:probable lipoprotein [Hydrogenimonas sp.]|nr:probable lipoprotein [Hydrogenimonas sp.]
MRISAVYLKKVLIVSAFLLISAGCSIKKVPPTDYYYISQKTPGITLSEAKGTMDSLRVTFTYPSRVSESSSIYYLDRNFRQQPYAYSRWYDTPDTMFEGKLIRALEESGIAESVTGGTTAADTQMVLEIGILEFVHDFSGEGASRGRVAVLVSLIRNRDSKTVCSRLFEEVEPAPSEDAKGGVAALNIASDKVVKEIVEWLESCRSL